ncbi:hypothetical protein LuPra_05113 [Luteitalea pratensis]|uniref:Uncharacterized protein n=1 Tax=Luteitalea pratensis TaxID=1855912 RepID=A0A143PUI5_LUTPR|nr:hypothetical protein LuPra_05113 [Luteitalea pratensis]
MRLRVLVGLVSIATVVGTCSSLAGCKAEPAATVKEANALDVKAAEAPNPVGDPRFREFFDRVGAYVKVHDTADARVPSLKETSDPRQLSEREKALADEIRVERAGAHQGDVFSPAAAKEMPIPSPRISRCGRSAIKKPSCWRYP